MTSLLYWAEVAVAVASVVLGLVIGYQAYRGFRRNDSRSMQYLSLGLIFLTAVPFTLSFVGTLVINFQPDFASFERYLLAASRTIQLAGLVFITYSLYEKP
jgi:hypothetical protein